MPTCIHCDRALNSTTANTHRCRATQRPPRRKSCAHCYSAKVRCEPSTHGCVRCEVKNLECQFPSGSMPRVPYTRIELPSPRPSVPSRDGLDGLENIGDDINFSEMLDGLGSNYIHDINAITQPTFSWAEFGLPTPNQSEFPPEPVSGTPSTRNNNTSDILVGEFEPPWTPGHFLYPRYLPRDTQSPGMRSTVVSLTERLMVMALRSYPNMMQPDGFPPFIHPTQPKHEDMKTTLENCISLILLWKSQKEFNNRFVRESIDRERMKLLGEVYHSLHLSQLACVVTDEQYRSSSVHGMLAAIQAFTIYALLEYLNLDSEGSRAEQKYIPAIHDMAYYSFRPGMICHSELIGQRPSWEDWVLVESRRRLMVVLFIFDSLCELQKGRNVIVCPEVSEMPLPSSKRLWEAPNREIWEIEYEKFLRSQCGRVEMLKLKDLWVEPSGERLEEWIAGMDVLGSEILGIAVSANETGRL